MDELGVYANRRIEGIKIILIVLILTASTTFVIVPVSVCAYVKYAFIKKIEMSWLLPLPLLLILMIEFSLLYMTLKFIFGKLHIIIDDFKRKLMVVEKIPGFKAKVKKEIDISYASIIRMGCVASHVGPRGYYSDGDLPLYPVTYNIKVCDSMKSTLMISSGNYELVEDLYQKLCFAFPSCEAVSDLSSKDVLTQQYKACINRGKLRMMRPASLLFLLVSIAIGSGISGMLSRYKLSKAWTKVVAIAKVSEKEIEEVEENPYPNRDIHIPYPNHEIHITYPWQGRLYSSSISEFSLECAPRSTFSIKDGGTIEIYVNPQNSEEYVLGVELSQLFFHSLFIVFVISSFLVIVTVRLIFKYKKIDKEIGHFLSSD